MYRLRAARADIMATLLASLGAVERSRWQAQALIYRPSQQKEQADGGTRGQARGAASAAAGAEQREVCVVVMGERRDTAFLVHE